MGYVTLTTDTKSMHRETFTSGTSAPSGVIIQAARPASATNNVVVGGNLNYLKFKVYSSTSTAPTIYVYGWNYCPELNAYVPQLLCSFTTTLSGSQSLPVIGTAYEVIGATLSTGDAKIFSGASVNGGFLLVDTLGCEFIDFRSNAAGGPTINILHAGL